MPPSNAPHPVLILFAHPALEKSRVNVRLARAVRGLKAVTFHDLYEEYPDLDIDVPREQRLLREHDVIVFQHPFYWYSAPAMLKEWQDLVLEHGWAYGHEATALQAKKLLCAITAGGRESSYGRGGSNHFTMRELLAPIEQTARLCGMDYLPPFVVHGTHRLSPERIEAHAEEYRRTVIALRDGTIDFRVLRARSRINEALDETVHD